MVMEGGEARIMGRPTLPKRSGMPYKAIDDCHEAGVPEGPNQPKSRALYVHVCMYVGRYVCMYACTYLPVHGAMPEQQGQIEESRDSTHGQGQGEEVVDLSRDDAHD